MNKQALKIPLVLVCLCLSAAVVSARNSPAHGYEVSIYTATPLFFWAVSIASIGITVYYIFVLEQYYRTSFVISGVTATAVLSLPLIRNYHHIGDSDTLTHVGYIQDIGSGSIQLFDLFYPASHVLSIIMSDLMQMEVNRVLILISLIFVIIFFVSVPCAVRLFYTDSKAVGVAAFSAFMLAPIGRHGVQFVPNQLARLYVSFVLLLILLIYFDERREHSLSVGVSLTFLVFLHPQISVTFLFVLVGMIMASIAIATVIPRSISTFNKTISILALSYGILIHVWIESKDVFVGQFRGFVLSISSPDPGGDTTTMTDSLIQVGGSIFEIFIKLLFQPSIYIIFTTIFIIYILYYMRKEFEQINLQMNSNEIMSILLFFGLFPLVIIFLAALILNQTFLRYMYFALVITTMLGSIGMYAISKKVDSTILLPVIILILLILGVAIYQPSPYIYSSNNQVPESHISGYDTAFEYTEGDLPVTHLRGDTWRYAHATVGTEISRWDETYSTGTPDRFGDQGLNVSARYLAVTELDKQREITAFRGLRFGEAEFEYLDNSKGIDNIMDNGEFDLYKIEANHHEPPNDP